MSVKVETLAFEKLLKDYAEIRETTIPKAVAMNARLLCVELARRTQPFGNKTGGEKIGEKAITKDIFGGRRSSGKGKSRAGLFAPISDFMAANAEEYPSGNIRLFVKKDGTVYGTDRAHFLPGASASDIASIHRSNFVNGRMSAAGGDTRDIGRWKFINKYYVPKSELDAFVATRFARVGLAKSGWAWCAKLLKNPVKGSATRGIPKWVTRHLGDYGLGQVVDNTDDKNNPRISLTNTSKYADKVISPVEQLNAAQIVARKMKTQMARILKSRATTLAEAA
jgi:hypothetical protein